MRVKKGITIFRIDTRSPLYAAGLQKGDVVCAVNGEPVDDELDFSFTTARDFFEIAVCRKKKKMTVTVQRAPGEFLGVEFSPTPIRRCKNRCVFCFIDQLPPGLRKRLYVKDEDYRHSFLDGNYVTLTSLTKGEMDKIVRLGLSPLYISVHATVPAIRKKMLNNPHAGAIMEQLHTLQDNGIAFHTQIVVCPGFNDGPVLLKTIRDLLTFQHGLLSVAVVPVGLTRHRKVPLRPVSRRGAQRVCAMVMALSEEDKKAAGVRRLFIADEFLLKAGMMTIPPDSYYEDYPQIENGVGLVRLLLDEWKNLGEHFSGEKIRGASAAPFRREKRKQAYLLLTSVSAWPFLERIAREIQKQHTGIAISVEPVVNRFFGESVTVAGLLSARDIIRTIKKSHRRYRAIILPRVVFNYNGYTLDGYSPQRIMKQCGTKLTVVDNLTDLVDRIGEK